MANPPKTMINERGRFSFGPQYLRHRRWISGIGAATMLLVAICIVAVRQNRELSPSELRIVGCWTFSTCDSSKLPRIFEFRDDRIAVVVEVGQSLATDPSFYDWRVDDEELVLTRYEEREVGESTLRKVRRAGSTLQERLQAKPTRREPIETYVITHKGADAVALTPSQGCAITLFRAGRSGAGESTTGR